MQVMQNNFTHYKINAAQNKKLDIYHHRILIRCASVRFKFSSFRSYHITFFTAMALALRSDKAAHNKHAKRNART